MWCISVLVNSLLGLCVVLNVSTCACMCECMSTFFVWVSVCVWLCWGYQNLVMPHQRACIRREEKQALWLVCGSSKPASHTLDLVGKKKENSIVFVTVIHEPKPQRVLFLPPILYVKQFKWCNLQESFFSFLFLLASFPRLLGKEIEVSSSASKRGVFSWNCLLFWMCRLVFSLSGSLQKN